MKISGIKIIAVIFKPYQKKIILFRRMKFFQNNLEFGHQIRENENLSELSKSARHSF